MPERLNIGIAIIFPIGFGVLWYFACYLGAQLGGWAQLGAIFPASGEPVGERLDFQRFRMG